MPLRTARRLRTSFKAVFSGEAENRHLFDVSVILITLAIIAYLVFLFYIKK